MAGQEKLAATELPPRYGGTRAPCDDPEPCEVGPRTGFCVPTHFAPSRLSGAGLGRFVDVAVPQGAVIRRQTVGTGNLLAFRSAAPLEAAFPLPADKRMLADFTYSCATVPALAQVVLLDAPPTMVRLSLSLPPPPHPPHPVASLRRV
jgi:hypothetical protein